MGLRDAALRRPRAAAVVLLLAVALAGGVVGWHLQLLAGRYDLVVELRPADGGYCEGHGGP